MTQCITHPISPCMPRERLGLWARLAQVRALQRQRHHLAQLSDLHLRDIGLTKDQAIAESRRMAWDIPQHWRGYIL